MKKLLLIIFFLFSFNCFANDEIKFENYLLKGNFKREVYRLDYFWSWDFRIFNNDIFLNFEGDMGGTDDPKKFPDGEYKLTTENRSKIKINVKNGKIKNFMLLSDKDDFKKNETDISNNYCKIAIFYSNYNSLYNELEHIYYYMYEEREVMDIIKYKDRLIACRFDYHSCIPIKDNSKYIFIDDEMGDSRNYIQTEKNKKMLEIISEDSDLQPDIIVNKCEVEIIK